MFKNICEMGKERIRRAGKLLITEHPEKKVDVGFKDFYVSDTTIKVEFAD